MARHPSSLGSGLGPGLQGLPRQELQEESRVVLVPPHGMTQEFRVVLVPPHGTRDDGTPAGKTVPITRWDRALRAHSHRY